MRPTRQPVFFLLGAAWVKSRAERPSVSEVNQAAGGKVGSSMQARDEKTAGLGGKNVACEG